MVGGALPRTHGDMMRSRKETPSPDGRGSGSLIRLFIDQPLREGAEVAPSAGQEHYLRRVMRQEDGSRLILFDGSGGEYEATLHRTGLRVAGRIDIERELPLPVTVIQGACRSERIEWMLQKATELGAAAFTIVGCARATLQLPESRRARRLKRWRRIVIEAAEQSGRTRIPTVAWADRFDTVAAALPPGTLRWLLHPRGTTPWAEARGALAHADALALAVGPEGGFTDQEVTLLERHRFHPLSFGPRTMRSETAAPALLAAVQALLA
ncbi:MAG: 16S rRNA (uracil(1498)-N(3))-methyltransferase [Zetaproteobacteria bacterium]|nr:MAG: 16S rRNA (uracil(1498)-N(3))-methyltransferase [Zetaproteobacteria bacterium]